MMCRMPRPSRPETDRRVEASRQRALARTTGPRASAPGAPAAAVVGAAEPADELEQAVRTARRAAATRATRLGSQGEQARAVAPVVAASSVRSSSSEACPSERARISVAGAFAGAKTPSPSLVRPPVRARPLESPKARRQSTVVRRMVRPRRWRLRRFPRSARRWSGAVDTPRPCRRVRSPATTGASSIDSLGDGFLGRLLKGLHRRQRVGRGFPHARRPATDPWRETRGRRSARPPGCSRPP